MQLHWCNWDTEWTHWSFNMDEVVKLGSKQTEKVMRRKTQ